MKYRNTKTQAVIVTACELHGGNWVKVEDEQPKTTTSATVAAKAETKSTPSKSAVKKTPAKKTVSSKTTVKTTRKKSGE